MAKILGVGNAVLDLILTVPCYPKEDEELRIINKNYRSGGNVNNFLYVLSQLGHKSSIVTTIANDSSAKQIMAELDTRNINTSNVQRFIQGQTPTSYIMLSEETGSRTITHFRDLPELSFEHFAKIAVEEYDWIHFEARNTKNLQGMINIAKTFLTAQPISLEVEKNRAEIEEIIPLASLVIFSHHYAKQTGYKNAVELLKKMRSIAPQSKLVCTWGVQGAWYCEANEEIKHQPTEKTPNTIDTLGAGDTFNAGLINALIQKKTLAEAIASASKLAALKCQKTGLDNLLTKVIEKQPLANTEQLTNSKATIVPCSDLSHSVILIKYDTEIKAYLNNCPHQDVPLNEAYKIDVNPFEKTLKCSVHDAFFKIDDGNCIEGPCINEELKTVAIDIDDDGNIFLA